MEFNYATKNPSKLQQSQGSKCSRTSQINKQNTKNSSKRDELHTTELVFAATNDEDVDEAGLA